MKNTKACPLISSYLDFFTALCPFLFAFSLGLSVGKCIMVNFFLKNNSSRVVDAAYICEALKYFMHYVAQMATLGKKKSQLVKFKCGISLNCNSPFICYNILINGTQKQKVSLIAIYFYFPPNINATSTVNLKNLI